MNKLILFVLLLTFMTGVNAMSFLKNDTIINWEWPANRIVKHKMVVEVVDLGAVNKWIKSPSFAADIPDPMSLRGRVLRSDLASQIEIIKLVLPKIELGDVSKGSKLALGMINNNTVVCTGVLPLNLSGVEEDTWLEQWECK